MLLAAVLTPLSDSSASHPHTATSFYPEPPSPILSHDPNAIQPRGETAQRKRPKYTRSKTGCLTCRVKKIKCDETKPSCSRCVHAQRDCTWPEGVPAWAMAPVGKDGANPHTESPRFSGASAPPADYTLLDRGQIPLDLNLPPLVSHRHSDHYLPSFPDLVQRQTDPGYTYPTQHHHSTSSGNAMPLRPDMPSFGSPTRFDLSYSHVIQPGMQPGSSPRNSYSHPAPMHNTAHGTWNQYVLPAADASQSYVLAGNERNLVSSGYPTRYP